jgi:hypothetical protein
MGENTLGYGPDALYAGDSTVGKQALKQYIGETALMPSTSGIVQWGSKHWGLYTGDTTVTTQRPF